MPTDFDDILDGLARDVAAEAKIALDDAKRLLAEAGPLVLRWETEARNAETAGHGALAAKKRASIQHVKHAAILDIATHAVVALDKVERGILAAFDRAIAMLP